MHRRPLNALALAALCTIPGGCCSLARLWCGPDQSPWFDPGYATPQQAVTTVLEGVKRDRTQVLFESMTPELRAEMGLPTVMEEEIFRQRIGEEAPYLFMLGYADPGDPIMTAPDLARFEFDVEGRPVTLTFLRQPMRRVLLDLPFMQAEPVPVEDRLPGSTLAGAFTVRTNRGEASIEAAQIRLPTELAELPPEVQVQAAQILRVEYTLDWRLHQFSVAEN